MEKNVEHAGRELGEQRHPQVYTKIQFKRMVGSGEWGLVGCWWIWVRIWKRFYDFIVMGPNSVHDLDIWRESVCFVKNIYDLTSLWPRDERFGIIAQARSPAVSIPANLAEGRGRQSAPGDAPFCPYRARLLL